MCETLPSAAEYVFIASRGTTLPFAFTVDMYSFCCEDGCLLVCRAIALMMEAASASETLVNFYQTTQLYNPEDGHLHACCCENLKSYLAFVVFVESYITTSALQCPWLLRSRLLLSTVECEVT
jgi:hypothetical protein